MRNRKKIVVVGGGIAGFELVTRLSKQIGFMYDLYLIDKSDIHTWKPMLHMFATGTTTPDEQGVSFIRHAKQHGFQFVPGVVSQIDRQHKILHLNSIASENGKEILAKRSLSYDYLILTVGSCTNDFGTEGVKDFAYTIDDLEAATHFLSDFQALLLNTGVNKVSRNIVIVGAGATGIELSGEIHKVMEWASGYLNEPLTNYIDVTIVQGDSRVLPAFTEEISANTQKVLEQLGVRVILNESVIKVEEGNVTLRGGEVLPADMTIWTAGVKAHEFLKTLDDVELSKTGQLIVDVTFQSVSDPSLFAIGDSSYVKNNPQAPTAQVARQEAVYLGKNFLNIIEGREITRKFNFRDSGSLVSVGRYASFGVFGSTKFKRITIRGLIASMAHQGLYRMHQISILGFWRAFCSWASERLTRLAKR